MAIAAPQSKDPSDFHLSGIVFAVIVFLYQVMICLFYAYWAGFNLGSVAIFFDEGQIQLVAVLTILVLVGFGLTNAYITNASFSGMGMTLLIFGLTLQHYFLIKAFWQKAGVSDINNSKSFTSTSTFHNITFVNYGQDLYTTSAGTLYEHPSQFLVSYSFVDAIACALANVVAFSSVVGRVKLFETFWLTLFGTFLYEVNAQLLWRYNVSDTGYGMRIFVFGGFLGLISSVILGRKQTTINNQRYISVYASRGFALLGLLFQFCTFPGLVAASLFRTSANQQIVLYSSVLRMYFALVSGILGSFTASALTYRKIFAHDLIFGGLAGGIVYSSSSDLHPNPGVPLAVGYIFGLICSLYHSVQLRSLNKNGVVASLAHLDRFIIPGIFSGILSAVLYAINQGDDGNHKLNFPTNRTNIQQGGYQLAGLSLSIAFGIGAGIVVGLIYAISNHHKAEDQFRDAQIFRPDFPPSIHLVDWKET